MKGFASKQDHFGKTIIAMEQHKHILNFTPARSGRSSEDVALQLEAAILSGQILPGQGLPSEREMQNQFQTSRGVVREALRALKEKGLLEIRKGAKGGAYVRELDVKNVSQPLALLLKQRHVAPEHVLEFRESTDRTITLLAIARSDSESRQQLLQGALKLQELAQDPESKRDLLDEMDRELNIQLARLAQNPIFEWVMNAIQQGFSSQDYALYQDDAFREQTAANWVETARNIVEGEPIEALSSIGNHYVLLRRCIRQRRQQDPAEQA